MYGDGSSTSCLDYIDYDLPNGYRRKLGSWSPDGSKFAHDRNDDTGIFIWDLNGRVTAFQESGEGLVFRQPFWSTNGEYIAYQIEPVAQWNIPADVPGTYIESLDHSYKSRISPEEVSVDWSPDGQSLLFSDGDIYIAMSNGANPSKLTHDTAGYAYPTWSPDGLLIAFLRLDGSYNELYIMNADGSGIRKVAALDFRNSYAMFNYTWLPSGRYILYDDHLIDTETGISSHLRFPFDPSSAVWFTKPKSNGFASPPASH
jgi:Tol biopolymer transport system component